MPLLVIVCVIVPNVGRLIKSPPLVFVNVWLPLMVILLLSIKRVILKFWKLTFSAAPAFFQCTPLAIESTTTPVRVALPTQLTPLYVIVIVLGLLIVSNVRVALHITACGWLVRPVNEELLSNAIPASTAMASVSPEKRDWSSECVGSSVSVLSVEPSFSQAVKITVVKKAIKDKERILFIMD